MATQEVILHDKDLEELVLISLLKSPPSVKDYLLGSIREEHFHTPWWREVHHRIRNLVRDKNQIPNELDILHDPVISEPIKIAIKASLVYQNDLSIKDTARCKSAIEQLSQLSKSRKLYGLHSKIGDYFIKGDKDLKKIVNDVSNKLYEINTDTEDFETSIFHLTNEKESEDLLTKILNERDDQYIPTGFKQFDSVNKGLPRGGLTILAATTGGCKCLVTDSVVPTSQGNLTLGELWNRSSGQLDQEGFNSMNEEIFVYTDRGRKQRILHTYKTRGKTLRVTFSDGSTIQGLAEHKIWVLEYDGKPSFKRLDEIKEGDQTYSYNHNQVIELLR